MTREEINERRNALESLLLQMQARMAESDDHAIKCNKLGLRFSEEYPGEYLEYEKARVRYNEIEAEIAALDALEPEEEEVGYEEAD